MNKEFKRKYAVHPQVHQMKQKSASQHHHGQTRMRNEAYGAVSHHASSDASQGAVESIIHILLLFPDAARVIMQLSFPLTSSHFFSLPQRAH